MIYMRGQRQDYDNWADQHGCANWRYSDVLPAFIKQERNTRLGDPYHGRSGRLIVNDPSSPHPIAATLMDAARSAGLSATDDFNGAQQEGAGWYQVTASRGKRQSAATCFLGPELHRENLKVLTGLTVGRIQIENRRAVAVEVMDAEGRERVLRASREIILTAGSFHSPKLLMLSGVGPADELLRHGVNLVLDTPEVGQNLQDHVGTPVTRRLKGELGLHGQDRGFAALKNRLEYVLLRRGLLTSNLLQAGACADTTGDGRPDVQFNLAPFAPDSRASRLRRFTPHRCIR